MTTSSASVLFYNGKAEGFGAMKHVFDFITSDEETSVSRILAMVHQAIDRELPSATPAPARFAKTSFGDEPTLNQAIPVDLGAQMQTEQQGASARALASEFEDETELFENKVKEPATNLDDPTEGFQSIQYRRRNQTIIASVILIAIMIVSLVIWSIN